MLKRGVFAKTDVFHVEKQNARTLSLSGILCSTNVLSHNFLNRLS